MKKMWSVAAIGAAFVFGFLARGVVSEPVAHAQSPRVYELRTYTAPDGKLEELHARFRNHTLRIFQKHGMSNVAYFKPQDAPLSQNTLIYLIAHRAAKRPSRTGPPSARTPSGRRSRRSRRSTGRSSPRSSRSSSTRRTTRR